MRIGDMPKHILVPFDRSPQARRALEFALEEYPGEEITVIHVPYPSDQWYASAGEHTYAERIVEQAEADSQEVLDNAQRIASGYGQGIGTKLRMGPPPETIVEYAVECDVDHIVIGSHRRSGIRQALLGSIAESVTKRSPVPVTIIH